jgi:hypothetical protein
MGKKYRRNIPTIKESIDHVLNLNTMPIPENISHNFGHDSIYNNSSRVAQGSGKRTQSIPHNKNRGSRRAYNNSIKSYNIVEQTDRHGSSKENKSKRVLQQ